MYATKVAGWAVLVTALVLLAIQARDAGRSGASPEGWAADAGAGAPTSGSPGVSEPAAFAADDSAARELRIYLDAARGAWRLVENNYQPNTGLISATPDYHYATTWDIGSGLGALYAAHELGLISDREYDKRMRRMLATLKTVPLVANAAYNKKYATRSGGLINPGDKSSAAVQGWSAIDLGRFLIWLKIVEVNDPQYAEEIRALVGRMDFRHVVKDGYLYGELPSAKRPGTRWAYQEGRIGYEQYVAAGFALWGHAPRNALRLHAHAKPIKLLGHELLQDTRGLDRLTSEPFFLMQLELGWTEEMAKLARSVLAVQEERYKRTGRLTMVSEDALAVPPHYFYYYCIYCNRREWIIDLSSPGQALDSPRWISTKATFGWHAVLPNPYTALLLDHVREKARSPLGWYSGFFEQTEKPTGATDINTAAVVLEAALYLQQRHPLIHARGWQALLPTTQRPK